MLTYRKAAVGTRDAAAAMAQYLVDGALSPERAAMVHYYAGRQGAEPQVAEAVLAHMQDVAAGHAGATAIPAGIGHNGGPPLRDVLPEVRRDMHPHVAAALGLTPGGTVSEEELTRLFAGSRADGAPMPGQKREIAFLDLCWSADKSVSLAWAFAPTEAERATILHAHRAAVDDAMRYAATVLGRARKGHGGRDGADQGHVGWVKFDHYSARPTVELKAVDPTTGAESTTLHQIKQVGDPLLHTHAALFNLVATEDGRIGSLDTQRLDGRIHEFGAYYHARLAANLRAAGIPAELSREGAARIPSVPEWVCREFSKRTEDAERAAREFAKREGVEWDALTDEGRAALLKGAAIHRREAKEQVGADFDAWQAQAAKMRWRHRSVIRGPGRSVQNGDRSARLEHAYRVALDLFEKDLEARAALGIAAPRVAAARGLIAAGIEDERDIDAITRAMRERGVRQGGRMTALIWGHEGEKAVKVTTALHAEQEDEFVRLARAAAADRSLALDPALLRTAVAATGVPYTDEQRTAIRSLGEGGKLGVTIGAAGVGKTTLLAPLVSAWEAEGRRVIGAGLAWNYAHNMTEAGIGRENVLSLAALHRRVTSGRLTLGPRDVVVVDEAARLGTRQALDLLRWQAERGFALVMVGDDRQCQSIEAGPIMDLLRRALGPDAIPEVLTTVRQRAEREREIASLFREGRAAEALAMKREDGTAEAVAGGRREVLARAADLFMQRQAANQGVPGYTLTVSAPTNADARELALAIRQRRREAGEIGRRDRVVIRAQDGTGTAHDLPLAEGDRLRLYQRTWGKVEAAGGKPRRVWLGNNGSVVTVEAVERDGLRLRGADGTAARVTWDDLRDRDGMIRLAYGDVLTVDAVQSRTSTEHINALPSGSSAMQGFQAYVAESRHRVATWLVTSDGAERQEVARLRHLGDARPITAEDVWANVARNLSRQPVKESALAFLDRAQDVHRGSVGARIAGQGAWERRAAAGQPPGLTGQQMELNRVRGEIARLTARLDRTAAALGQAIEAQARPAAPAPSVPQVNSAEARTSAGQARTAAPRPAAPILVPRRPAEPPRPAIVKTQADHIADFADALRSAGLRLKGPPVMDGQRHRVAVEGDRGTKRSGFYIGHLDGVPAGFIRNHKTGAEIRWKGDAPARSDPREAARLRAETMARAAERERQRQARQETVARRVELVWERGAPAPADHPYLVAKGVQPHGLRVDRRGRLLVPMMDAHGRVWSLQRIGPDGAKRFAKGGRAVGGGVLLGELTPGGTVVMAEGFATAATVREATGLPVVVAFNAGNLEAVAKGLRERDPSLAFVFAADNDHHLPRRNPPLANVGVDKAEAAAREVGGRVLVPAFEPHHKGTDWNDLCAMIGRAAVREALMSQIEGRSLQAPMRHQERRAPPTISR